MNELKMKDTPLPDGFRCIDCKLFRFCSDDLKISKELDICCKFEPYKFERKHTIDKSCVFYSSGHLVGPNTCEYFDTKEEDINCYKCKVYLDHHSSYLALKKYVKNKIKNQDDNFKED